MADAPGGGGAPRLELLSADPCASEPASPMGGGGGGLVARGSAPMERTGGSGDVGGGGGARRAHFGKRPSGSVSGGSGGGGGGREPSGAALQERGSGVLAAAASLTGGGRRARSERPPPPHLGPVTAVAFAAGRAFTAAAGKQGGSLCVWDAASRRLLGACGKRDTQWLRAPVDCVAVVDWPALARAPVGGVEAHVVTGHDNGQARRAACGRTAPRRAARGRPSRAGRGRAPRAARLGLPRPLPAAAPDAPPPPPPPRTPRRC